MALFEIVDLIAEIPIFPWLYRGWAYVLSPTYRTDRKRRWREQHKAIVIIDIGTSAVLAIAELCLLSLVPFLLYKWIIS